MNPRCVPIEHLNRRTFLKGTLTAASGGLLPNWGGLFSTQAAAEARQPAKRCILLWMLGGPSQLDTFDLKPGRPGVGGPFRPIATKVPGTHICEYLPRIAQQADKLAIIRSMRTPEPGHSAGAYLMHTGYRPEANIKHPEFGALAAKFLGRPDSDLPSFIQVATHNGESSPNPGAGFLGPNYQPFILGEQAGLPENTAPYLKPDADQRRAELLRFVEEQVSRRQNATEFESLQLAQDKARRLLRGKSAFDISGEWVKYRDRYGDSQFGKNCLLARRLVEAGVPFVEVGQSNYDSHADNFDAHKGLLPPLDHAWSGLLEDLAERGMLQDTLVVWMGEVGRTPWINNRAGRDHWVKAWSLVLAGAGIRGGALYGESDADAKEVKDKPVSEGDLFATIYTALGINPKAKHFAGTRPIWVAAEGSKPIAELLA